MIYNLKHASQMKSIKIPQAIRCAFDDVDLDADGVVRHNASGETLWCKACSRLDVEKDEYNLAILSGFHNGHRSWGWKMVVIRSVT